MFAVAYGYTAAYNKRLESLLIATLDILQSIPVLSFLPGVMLAMMSLFPSRQLGIEMGAILLIFTGEVWNMAFSFYTSLKSIPRELMEATAINRFSRVAKAVPAGAAVRGDWAGVELDCVGGQRMVLPDGVRDVSGRQQEFPAAGAGIVSADGSGARRLDGGDVGADHHGADCGDHRPAAVAAADCVVRQIQI